MRTTVGAASMRTEASEPLGLVVDMASEPLGFVAGIRSASAVGDRRSDRGVLGRCGTKSHAHVRTHVHTHVFTHVCTHVQTTYMFQHMSLMSV